jgi:(p)ppGpp synthase/HD superfamily hydrolase
MTLAEQIATAAHAGQTRRDGLTPYISHPAAVVNRLKGESEDVIAAAWLHDVVEDTLVGPYELLKAGINPLVIEAVMCLTKRRGQGYFTYLCAVKANPIARKVKIADMLHNLSDSPTDAQIVKYAKGLLALVEERRTEGRAS